MFHDTFKLPVIMKLLGVSFYSNITIMQIITEKKKS